MGSSSAILPPRVQGGGVVVQTAFSNKTDVASDATPTNAVWVSTLITCSITPRYANSTIYGEGTLSLALSSNVNYFIRVDRSGVTLDVNNTSATTVASYTISGGTSTMNYCPIVFEDNEHNTTSPITYTVYIAVGSATVLTAYTNRESTDTDANTIGRYASSLFLEEVV